MICVDSLHFVQFFEIPYFWKQAWILIWDAVSYNAKILFVTKGFDEFTVY